VLRGARRERVVYRGPFLDAFLVRKRELMDCPQIEFAACEVRNLAGLNDLFGNP
jgi:hypothetical protein